MLRNTQQVMLRIHFLQQWFGLSDVAMEEALFDVPLYRQFAGLGGMNRLPDRVSILRFRHLQVVDRYRSPPRKQALPGGGACRTPVPWDWLRGCRTSRTSPNQDLSPTTPPR